MYQQASVTPVRMEVVRSHIIDEWIGENWVKSGPNVNVWLLFKEIADKIILA